MNRTVGGEIINRLFITYSHGVLTCIATRGAAISYVNITTFGAVVIFKLINSNLADTYTSLRKHHIAFLHQ